jgi:hypothetical protein
MNINLEILDASFIYDKNDIKELNTKELVPKMVTRRRLTKSAKIAIYLDSQIKVDKQRIIFGSSYGELKSTQSILSSINSKEQISPTVFQNSVYNTAVSYLSMLKGNTSEIMTISSGDITSLNILKAGAIKALDGDEIVLIVTEVLNIDHIEDMNKCIDYLEVGVALKVKVTKEEKTISVDSTNNQKYPLSVIHMLNIAKSFDKAKQNIVEINL